MECSDFSVMPLKVGEVKVVLHCLLFTREPGEQGSIVIDLCAEYYLCPLLLKLPRGVQLAHKDERGLNKLEEVQR